MMINDYVHAANIENTYPFTPVLQVSHQVLLHVVKLGNLLLNRFAIDAIRHAIGDRTAFDALLEALDFGRQLRVLLRLPSQICPELLN